MRITSPSRMVVRPRHWLAAGGDRNVAHPRARPPAPDADRPASPAGTPPAAPPSAAWRGPRCGWSASSCTPPGAKGGPAPPGVPRQGVGGHPTGHRAPCPPQPAPAGQELTHGATIESGTSPSGFALRFSLNSSLLETKLEKRGILVWLYYVCCLRMGGGTHACPPSHHTTPTPIHPPTNTLRFPPRSRVGSLKGGEMTFRHKTLPRFYFEECSV